MGRGLGIFPARPKTPFVPGEATTRDKRTFCPGSWLHPGQKAPPIYFLPPSFALPPNTCFFWCRRRPLRPAPLVPRSVIPERRPKLCRPQAPPRAPPPHSAVVPDLRRPEPPPRAPTSSLLPARARRPPPRRLRRRRPRPPPRPCAAPSSPSRPRPELH